MCVCGATAHNKQTTKKIQNLLFSLSLSMKWKVLLSRWSLRLPTLLLLRATTPTLIRWACHKRELALSPSSWQQRPFSFFFFYDTMWWLHLLKGTLMAAAPISLRPSSSPPVSPITGKKNNKETKWEKDILQKNGTKNPSEEGSITLYKFDDENEPGRTQMGIYIYIYSF